MIPVVGSEWYARDGRVMRVDEIVLPADVTIMPRAKMTVLNAGRGMRKKTEMSVANFGDELYIGFLRPRAYKEAMRKAQ